ncbi:T9SS type A sorting domain-containing protein [Candidatus Latescibacterota bacterium]
MKRRFQVLFLLSVVCAVAGTLHFATGDVTNIQKTPSAGLGANDLGDIAWDGSSLWVTGSGTLTNLIGDGYSLHDWISYEGMDGFGQGSISALYASGDTLITAWVFNDDRDGDAYITGDGYSISTDRGVTWRHVDILDLFPERSGFKYPGTYTMTYDFSFVDNVLWCATTYGYLKKSEDIGQTWTSIYPNADEFDFQNVNHHGYCVEVYGDTLWVGTFMGINASFDAGETWENFSWPADGSVDLENPMPGNWVLAVESKVMDGKRHIWVGCKRELVNTGLGVYGICHTDDNGETWKYKSTTYNAYNFAFGHNNASNPKVSDETVMAASDSGLVISHDLGETWDIIDISSGDGKSWVHGDLVSGVKVVGDMLYVTSSDGFARSDDWGDTWEIFQGVTRVTTLDTGKRDIGISTNYDKIKTYAFPNPFSPSRSDREYSRTRIQYSIENATEVSINIYSYSGKLIKELIDGDYRTGGRDYQESWNGADENGNTVPNGVYFYEIKTGKGDSARGKIMVLD